MKAKTRALIQAAKARAEHQSSKAMTQAPSAGLIDEMMREERWYTFVELAERFRLSYSYVSRSLAGREGVAKFGSDYRVSETAVRAWLSEALAKASSERNHGM